MLVGCPDDYESEAGDGNDEVGDVGGVIDDPHLESVDPLGDGMASSCVGQTSGGARCEFA